MKTKHIGGCHCGAVQFEVSVDAGNGSQCNCSVCNKIGLVTQIVKPDAFRLLTNPEALGAYAWGPKISTRYFCKTCGVHCFGKGDLAEIGGAFVSVSMNALEDVDLADVTISFWVGRHNNWEAGT